MTYCSVVAVLASVGLIKKCFGDYAVLKILSLNFEPLPPLISEINLKFDCSTLCVLNRSLVSQNFVLKSYLYQKLSRKNLWGSRPPLSLRA